MNCNDFKIWLQTASDQTILNPGKEFVPHLDNCRQCASRLLLVQQMVKQLNLQRSEELSENKSKLIVAQLLNYPAMPTENLRWLAVSRRIAAILVIALGLLAGLVATQLLLRGSNAENDPWNNEFTLLSENTEYTMFD